MVAREHAAVEGCVAVAVCADLANLLDKEWEEKSLEEILKAPVTALVGVSESDAEMLKQTFSINTIGDLVRNKYFQAAQELSRLVEAEMWQPAIDHEA
jgi:hypothetical protein